MTTIWQGDRRWVAAAIAVAVLALVWCVVSSRKPRAQRLRQGSDGEGRSIEWKSQTAVEALKEAYRRFGKPTHAGPKEGGLAVWREPSYFYEIRVEDKPVPHCCPKPHEDVLSAGVSYELSDPATLDRVLSMTQSVWYDQLTKTLWARCQSLGPVVATLLLATEMDLDPGLTPSEQEYGDAVRSSRDPQTFERMYRQLGANVVGKRERSNPKRCHGATDCSGGLYPINHMRPAPTKMLYPTAYPHRYANGFER